MCGRYASWLPPEYIRGLFKTVGGLPNFPPNYNLSPTDGAMVVRRHPETGERRLDVPNALARPGQGQADGDRL